MQHFLKNSLTKPPQLWVKLMLLSVCTVLLSACATGPDADPSDPLEPLNRAVTTFNDTVDGIVLKPAAEIYEIVTPQPVINGVERFFNNLAEVWSIPNSILQLKIGDAIESTMRVTVNLVFGFGGFLDIATEVGMQRHHEDLGQTLAYWDVPSGPYLVLPILGPSTVRDAGQVVLQGIGSVNTVVAKGVDPANQVAWRNALTAANIIETRAELLPATEIIDTIALDPYVFVRDAYLQQRAELIRAGARSTQETTPEEQEFLIQESQ